MLANALLVDRHGDDQWPPSFTERTWTSRNVRSVWATGRAKIADTTARESSARKKLRIRSGRPFLPPTQSPNRASYVCAGRHVNDDVKHGRETTSSRYTPYAVYRTALIQYALCIYTTRRFSRNIYQPADIIFPAVTADDQLPRFGEYTDDYFPVQDARYTANITSVRPYAPVHLSDDRQVYRAAGASGRKPRGRGFLSTSALNRRHRPAPVPSINRPTSRTLLGKKRISYETFSR